MILSFQNLEAATAHLQNRNFRLSRARRGEASPEAGQLLRRHSSTAAVALRTASGTRMAGTVTFDRKDLVDPSVPGRMLHIVYKPDASVSEPGGPLCPRACARGVRQTEGFAFPQAGTRFAEWYSVETRICGSIAFTATDQEPMLSLDFHFEAS
jgi:hypothetical protein